jgi:hypothetical protein
MLRAPLKHLHRTHSAGAADGKHKDGEANGAAGETILAPTVVAETHASPDAASPTPFRVTEDIPYADETAGIDAYRQSEETNGHVSEDSTLQIKSRASEQEEGVKTVTFAEEPATLNGHAVTSSDDQTAENDDDVIVPQKSDRQLELPRYVTENFDEASPEPVITVTEAEEEEAEPHHEQASEEEAAVPCRR